MDPSRYVPVVDISQHQGAVHFPTMRALHVAGVIMRASHGHAIDARLGTYVRDARAAGFADRQLGFYTFCNPKRLPARAAARVFADAVERALGHLDTFLMLDVEQYETESGALPVLRGDRLVMWLEEFVDELDDRAPLARRVVYTGASFWNPWVGVEHPFGDMDVILARYPFYTPTSPQPPADARLWADWILNATKARPSMPAGFGGSWEGWQFSAGFNRMGPTYGVQSAHLDLNIVDPAAWARWTTPRSTPDRGDTVADPTPTPPAKPAPVLTPMTLEQGDAMSSGPFIIIGRHDAQDDPWRGIWNGLVVRTPTGPAEVAGLIHRGMIADDGKPGSVTRDPKAPADADRTLALTLANPNWMTDTQIASYVAANPARADG